MRVPEVCGRTLMVVVVVLVMVVVVVVMAVVMVRLRAGLRVGWRVDTPRRMAPARAHGTTLRAARAARTVGGGERDDAPDDPVTPRDLADKEHLLAGRGRVDELEAGGGHLQKVRRCRADVVVW